LTDKAIEINTRDQFGETALHLVAHNNRIKLADRLLRESTIEVNCTDLFGRTPLFLAARNGHLGSFDSLFFA
jgi:ankyrin repeat protein